jgi:hypothetical protein
MIYRAMAVLPHDNAIPQDVTTNVFYFDDGSAPGVPTAATPAAIAAAVSDFYNGVEADSGSRIASLLGESIDPSACRVKIYNLTGPPPHVPVYDQPMQLQAVGTASLPREVSVCLSFRGALVSGVNQARRRGRVYIGPLSGGRISYLAGDARPDTNFRRILRAAAVRLIDNPDVNWVVRSGTGAVTVVTGGWVDDACDTQRRRGLRATVRDQYGS